jgi:hypothetical protein
MKKSILIFSVIISIALFISGTAHSFRNEGNGYNGFKWGMSLEDFLKSKKAKLRKRGNVYYGNRIKGIDVDIGYDFFNDILFGVKINFPEDKRKTIIKYFKKLHGKPSLKRDKRLYWVGTKTKIELKRKDVTIVDIKLEKEYLRERDKRKKSR